MNFYLLKGLYIIFLSHNKVNILEKTQTNKETYQFAVFYINLESNKKRSEHMEKLLNFVGLKYYHRIRGVDSSELYKNSKYLNSFNHSKQIKFEFEKHRKIVTVEGTQHRTGNWLSFLFLFKELASFSSSQPFLILEDDVDLRVDFIDILSKSMQVAPVDWEILLCGHEHHRSKRNKILSKKRRQFWMPTEFFVCTHCLVVRNSSISALIASHLDLPVFTSATDLIISSLIHSNNLKVYAAKEPLASQRRDIFNSNTNNPGNIPKYKLSNSAFDLMLKLKLF